MESDSGQNVFDKLFKLLEPDALSIEEGFRQCRFKLVKFFGYRHCEDAEGLADETISRLLKNVRAGQEISPDNPYRYVYAIAMNVFREYVRAKKKGEVIDDIEQIGDLSAPEEADDCLRQCLEQIPPEKRELLERYYLDDEGREAILREHGLTLNALRLKVHRIKNGLWRCWEDCRKRSHGVRN